MTLKSGSPGRLGHVPALDGIRGLAVLGVFLLHAAVISAGWIGVQIFFVLSGFLITSLLLADRDLPLSDYLKRFYWRRSLRIFPLYFGYLFALAITWMLIRQPAGFGTQAPLLFSYLYNFHVLLKPDAQNALVFHLWSLSIEEQFYLLWPWVVFFLPIGTLRKVVLGLAITGPVIRALAVVWLRTINDNPDFLSSAPGLTPCVLDAFAIGAAVALFRDEIGRISTGWLLMLVAFALLCGQLNAVIVTGRPMLNTTFGFPAGLWVGSQYTWGFTLINLSAAALIVAALRPSLVASVLSWRPLAYLGRISYGVYVFHLVALLAARTLTGPTHGLKTIGQILLAFGILLTIAGLSYRWFETPFLRLKDRAFNRGRRHPARATAL